MSHGRADVEYLIHSSRADAVPPATVGNWSIIKVSRDDAAADSERLGPQWMGPFQFLTVLRRVDRSNGFIDTIEVVMEDSWRELARHLPILIAGRGRIVVSGLGLGCVVRGLLAKPSVYSVDVVELDKKIIDHVAPTLPRDSRLTIHHADALTITWPRKTSFDFAWHDIWCPENIGLDQLHATLFRRYYGLAAVQGAWQFPRLASRHAAPWMPMLNGRRKDRVLGRRRTWGSEPRGSAAI